MAVESQLRWAETLPAIADGTSELLSACAWPLVVLIIAWWFRKEMAALISRLSGVKYKDLQIDLAQKLEEAEEVIRSSPPPPAVSGPEATAAEPPLSQQIDEIARVSPEAAVIRAWASVESALFAAASRIGVVSHDSPKGQSSARVIDLLSQHERIPASIRDTLHTLRTIRNRAAHWDHEQQLLPVHEAVQYGVLAKDLTERLSAVR